MTLLRKRPPQDLRPSAPSGRRVYSVRCGQCGRSSGMVRRHFQACADCRGGIEFRYPDRASNLPMDARSMWDFHDRLPIDDPANVVSLGEGMTPLVQALSFPDQNVFWKNEGTNPTGSQKDRAISVAISVAREHGFRRVIAASTGSVGLSCAAYCARGSLPCIVLIPNDTPTERIRPMLALGARVVVVDGTFKDVEEILTNLDPSKWYHASTVQQRNCYQREGLKTIAYEIVLQLGNPPDWLVVPVGGGGTLSGIWKGFVELKEDGLIERLPRLIGVQARPFNLLERIGVASSIDMRRVSMCVPDEHEPTVLRNLKHGFPPDAHSAMAALYASDGIIHSVSDEDALAGQLTLAQEDGIFCEPSATVTVAAITHAIEQKWIKPGDKTVAILTGAGFREPSVLSALEPIRAATLSEEELEKIIALF